MNETFSGFNSLRKPAALLLSLGALSATAYGCSNSNNSEQEGLKGGLIPDNVIVYSPEIIENTAATGKVKIYFDVAKNEPAETIDQVDCPELWGEPLVESPYLTADQRTGKTCTTELLASDQIPRAQSILARYVDSQQ